MEYGPQTCMVLAKYGKWTSTLSERSSWSTEPFSTSFAPFQRGQIVLSNGFRPVKNGSIDRELRGARIICAHFEKITANNRVFQNKWLFKNNRLFWNNLTGYCTHEIQCYPSIFCFLSFESFLCVSFFDWFLLLLNLQSYDLKVCLLVSELD